MDDAATVVRSTPLILGLIVALVGAAPAAAPRRIIDDPKRLALLRQLIVPEDYLRVEDRESARLMRDGYAAEWPCTYETTELGSPSIASLPTEQCYKMTKPQRIQGFWNDDFEGSQFCTIPKDCFYPHVGTWLEFADPKMEAREPTEKLYQVDFIGRRPLHSGSFGHFGLFPTDVVVDRIISIKQVQAPPPQPTKGSNG